MTGEEGEIWVEMITFPFRISPFLLISASLQVEAKAVRAPSASETNPTTWGLAPIPPSRPIIPRVGSLLFPELPLWLEILILMNSIVLFCNSYPNNSKVYPGTSFFEGHSSKGEVFEDFRGFSSQVGHGLLKIF